MPHKVAVIIGSLRKASITRRVAHGLIGVAPAGLGFETIEIGDLPLYNTDVEDAGAPEAWTRFRTAVAACDAVLFATPEYNRSMPGALKNALDIGSRPYGHSVWAGKPALVVSVSPGAMGGFGANHALRQSLVFLDMPVLQQPEAYIGNAADLVSDSGEVAEKSRPFFTTIMAKFAGWIAVHAPQGS